MNSSGNATGSDPDAAGAALSARASKLIEQEIQSLWSLVRAHDFGSALPRAQALLTELPENRDVLHLVAICQRRLGDLQAAFQTLERFEAEHPAYARIHEERGHCWRTVGDIAAALKSYRLAVGRNPTLLASWQAISDLTRSSHPEETRAAQQQLQMWSSLPAAVRSASGFLAEGELVVAESLLREFLRVNPTHVDAMRLLAQVGERLGILDDAEFLLESVLVFAPQYHLARYDYASVLSKRHKHAAALVEVRKLLAIEPGNHAYLTLYATISVGLGDHAEALRVYGQLVSEKPQIPELHLSIGHALKTLGRTPEAIASYREAAAKRPDFGDSYWSLANLKTYRFTDAEIAQMKLQESTASIASVDRYHLCFALGKALEDREQYASSFEYYSRGNQLKRAESRFDLDALELMLQRQAQLCTREFMAQRAGGGYSAADPIFIVGLPRSGSTLVEQILCSHSQVEGTMELADIPRMVQQLSGREHIGVDSRYPALLAELSPAKREELGRKYVADTRSYRTDRPFFIDKMPNNFRHIALIHLILPNAKIIDVRREPLGCCFSNFKQLFASGQEFTYSLEEIGRYYRAYVRIMDHWAETLPGKVLLVRYEDVVASLGASVQRILDFVGLDFEPSCLVFYKTARSVRTASSEQVRQPIYREGLDQWRHYEPWLDVLKRALGEN